MKDKYVAFLKGATETFASHILNKQYRIAFLNYHGSISMDAARIWWSKRYDTFILTREIGAHGNIHFHLILLIPANHVVIFPKTANTTHCDYKDDFPKFKWTPATTRGAILSKILVDYHADIENPELTACTHASVFHEDTCNTILGLMHQLWATYKKNYWKSQLAITELYSMLHYVFKIDKPDEMQMKSHNYYIRVNKCSLRPK